MKIFTYIHYFFYLGFNWNWKIACHIISHEIKGEKKYGINTTGSDELKKIKAAGIDISHATFYMPANYVLLEEIFIKLPGRHHHFLDFGCGMGRPACVAAHNGFDKVTGVDFSKEFCGIARKNLQHTKTIFPNLGFTIINKDAAGIEIPPDVDCIFFFNPFDAFIMKLVVKNILDSYHKHPRDINIIYLNPLYKKEFLENGFKEVYYTIKMTYMEAVILEKNTLPFSSQQPETAVGIPAKL